MGSTPPEKAGSAASITETSGEFGVAMGIASLGSLAAVVYRSDLSLPWDLPAGAGSAARQGVTEALRTARDLPGSVGVSLVDAATTAFTSAVTTVAGVGVAVFIGLAALVAVAFRSVPPTPAAVVDEVDLVAANDSSS
jgi:MFS transporter, DHA2 family, multidrug resistance protein